MRKMIASVFVLVLALSIIVVAHFVPLTTPLDEAPQLVASEFVPQFDPPPPRKPPTW
ncbi:MAG: hypothetical protein DDT20_01674 [Firmicutes bacterium]|nr:hypothetical protein [Bacillota bacterium]